MGEEVVATVVPKKQLKESSMNIEIDSANVRTLYEYVKYTALSNEQTEESVEAEVLLKDPVVQILQIL